MPNPLVTDPKSLEAVKAYIDGRIGNYQWQRQRAQRNGNRYSDMVGRMLQGELLDLRNAICGVPGSPCPTRKRLQRPADDPYQPREHRKPVHDP